MPWLDNVVLAISCGDPGMGVYRGSNAVTNYDSSTFDVRGSVHRRFLSRLGFSNSSSRRDVIDKFHITPVPCSDGYHILRHDDLIIILKCITTHFCKPTLSAQRLP